MGSAWLLPLNWTYNYICEVITRAILRLSKYCIYSELLYFAWEGEPRFLHPPPTEGPTNLPSGNPGYVPAHPLA